MTFLKSSCWLYLVFYCDILLAPLIVSSQPSLEMLLQHPKLVSSDQNQGSKMTTPKAYIIRLDDTIPNVTSIITNLMNTSVQDGGRIRFKYKHVFKGFSVTGISNGRMLEILDEPVVVSASRVRLTNMMF
jgi:hypothetical protein